MADRFRARLFNQSKTPVASFLRVKLSIDTAHKMVKDYLNTWKKMFDRESSESVFGRNNTYKCPGTWDKKECTTLAVIHPFTVIGKNVS